MGGGTNQIVMILLMVAVFYFFVIRPQAKKTKEEAKYRSSIEKGNKVITIGGVHGKVVAVNTDTVTIECEGGQKLKIEKNAILPPKDVKK